jgi:hypothetical protein
MPIQYYSPSWWNDRPAHARAKFAPKLIVTFPPGITDYFSRRSNNKLSVEELTVKYGATVFEQYDLDFDEAGGDEADDESEGDGEDDEEGEGDEVGSEDSDEESGSSDAGSVVDFLDDPAEQDDDMGDYNDADAEGEEDDDDEDADADAANMAQFAEAMDQDADV